MRDDFEHRDGFDASDRFSASNPISEDDLGGVFLEGMREVPPSSKVRESLLAQIGGLPQDSSTAGEAALGSATAREGALDEDSREGAPGSATAREGALDEDSRGEDAVGAFGSAGANAPATASRMDGLVGSAEASSSDAVSGMGTNVVSLEEARRSRVRRFLPRVAAIAAAFAVGIAVGHFGTMDEMSPTSDFSALNQAQDVTRVVDTMPDGHVVTLTWSSEMGKTAVTLPAEMRAGDGRALKVWIRADGAYKDAGMYDPAKGTTFAFLDMMPSPGMEVIVTEEPMNPDEDAPTGKPLVVFKIGEDTRAKAAEEPDRA